MWGRLWTNLQFRHSILKQALITAINHTPAKDQTTEVDQPQDAGSSDRSPQSSSRSHVQEIGMQRPLAHEY